MADRILEPLRAAGPAGTVFFSGAGISADAPTHGPLGRTLTDLALEAFFAPSTREVLNGSDTGSNPGYYARLGLDGWYRPRLEVVLDVVFAEYEEEGLLRALGGLLAPEPNDNHKFFARHLLAGGGHATANFDTCIERADERLTDHVLHFHGALKSVHSLRTLGARMAVIEEGLPGPVAEELDRLLFSDPKPTLVFAGYSGSDYFDITPHLLRRATQTAGQTIFWHHFNPTEAETTLEEAFRAAGAHVHRIEGPLSGWLTRLDQEWDLPDISRPAAAPSVPPLSAPATPNQREVATFNLFARLGLRQEVIDRANLATNSQRLDWLADAYWGAGQYRRALTCWIKAFSDDGPEAVAKRQEREGAVAWIRGQLFKAETLLWQANQTWVGATSGVSETTQIRLVETYLRVTEHMGRLPDTRWRVRSARRGAARAQLDRLTHGKRLGVHLTARVSSVRADVDRLPDRLRDLHRRTMEESDALHGMLNFTQGEYRRRVTAPTPADAPPTANDLALLLERNQVLGAHGDAARVALLPTAPQGMTPAQVWRLLKPVDYTRWHRVRLFLGFTVRWFGVSARGIGSRQAGPRRRDS